MPMFDYACHDCKFTKEHFDAPRKEIVRTCPECKSEKYSKGLGSFSLNIEYATPKEIMENKINPSIQETYKTIGKEFLDQDTKTLDNIYGKDKIEKTFYSGDD